MAAALVIVLGLLPLVAGCAGTRGGAIPYGVQDFGTPDAPQPLLVDAEYRIEPLDTLAINVYKFADLSGDVTVDQTGHITMPLIGSVAAVGQTPAQLQQELTQRYGRRYLQSPDISVAVKSSARRQITVDGAVRQPGMFPVAGPLTLLQAVARAGGPGDGANPRRIAVFRQIEGQRMAAAFDLVSIRRGEAEDPTVYSGDIIVVDGSSIRAIYKDVLSTLPIFAVFRPF